MVGGCREDGYVITHTTKSAAVMVKPGDGFPGPLHYRIPIERFCSQLINTDGLKTIIFLFLLLFFLFRFGGTGTQVVRCLESEVGEPEVIDPR